MEARTVFFTIFITTLLGLALAPLLTQAAHQGWPLEPAGIMAPVYGGSTSFNTLYSGALTQAGMVKDLDGDGLADYKRLAIVLPYKAGNMGATPIAYPKAELRTYNNYGLIGVYMYSLKGGKVDFSTITFIISYTESDASIQSCTPLGGATLDTFATDKCVLKYKVGEATPGWYLVELELQRAGQGIYSVVWRLNGTVMGMTELMANFNAVDVLTHRALATGPIAYTKPRVFDGGLVKDYTIYINGGQTVDVMLPALEAGKTYRFSVDMEGGNVVARVYNVEFLEPGFYRINIYIDGEPSPTVDYGFGKYPQPYTLTIKYVDAETGQTVQTAKYKVVIKNDSSLSAGAAAVGAFVGAVLGWQAGALAVALVGVFIVFMLYTGRIRLAPLALAILLLAPLALAPLASAEVSGLVYKDTGYDLVEGYKVSVGLSVKYKAFLGAVWAGKASVMVGPVKATLEMETSKLTGKDYFYLKVYKDGKLVEKILLKELGTFETGSGEVSAVVVLDAKCGGMVGVYAEGSKVAGFSLNGNSYSIFSETSGDAKVEVTTESKYDCQDGGKPGKPNPPPGSGGLDLPNPGLGPLGLALALAAGVGVLGYALARGGRW